MENKLIKKEDIVDKVMINDYFKSFGLANKLNQNEMMKFFNIAKAFNLNPFKKEIYCVKYGNDMSIITGYETYLKRAYNSGKLRGWTVTTEGTISKTYQESTLKAIITITVAGWTTPFVHEVEYSEYVQVSRDGRINSMWSAKPKTMIKKVAIAQGFRLAFPEEISGMPYIAEEYIDQDSAIIYDVKEEKKPIQEKKSNQNTAQKKSQITEEMKKICTDYSLLMQQTKALTEDQTFELYEKVVKKLEDKGPSYIEAVIKECEKLTKNLQSKKK